MKNDCEFSVKLENTVNAHNRRVKITMEKKQCMPSQQITQRTWLSLPFEFQLISSTRLVGLQNL